MHTPTRRGPVPAAPASSGRYAVGGVLERERVRGQARRAAARRAAPTAARRRRPTSHRSARRAGIVDTWVLRIVRRRRWNSWPSGSVTALRAVPRGDERRALVGEQRKRPAAARRGCRTPRSPAGRRASRSERRGNVIGGRRRGRRSRRRARDGRSRGSTATTWAPARCSSTLVSAPTTPSPNTTTVSSNTGPASRVICSAVSTNGNSVASRAFTAPSGITSSASATKRSWWGWKAKTDVAAASVGAALLDDADAAVAVPERVAERAAERADRLVDRQLGIELAPVGEQLGAGADAGVPSCARAPVRPRAAGGASTGSRPVRERRTRATRPHPMRRLFARRPAVG